MNPNIIIDKKKNYQKLTREELSYFFNGYLNKEIPDYQMAALLMAITINGMTDEETINLTEIFVESGDKLDLSSIDGIKADKHSTGGIGDKTTLIIMPILACCGLKLPKMSGRGLGVTGGTIDKLESIPNFKVNLTNDEILESLKKLGMVVCSQTDNLAPMDKEIYALRDVTGTVTSIPLIASSIMSKKIAGGCDKIFIDLKVGRGALIKNETEANCLKDLMVKIAKHFDKDLMVEFSSMNEPLGTAVGNAIEILEVIDILKCREKNNLTVLATNIVVEMLMNAKGITKEEALEEAKKVVEKGDAYRKFEEFVKNQHGDLSRIKLAKNKKIIKAPQDGFIKSINALEIGNIVKNLGGGRHKLEDNIDYGVGIYFFKMSKDEIKQNDNLCAIFYNEKEVTDEEVLASYEFVDQLEEEKTEEVKEDLFVADEESTSEVKPPEVVQPSEPKEPVVDKALLDTMKLIPGILEPQNNQIEPKIENAVSNQESVVPTLESNQIIVEEPNVPNEGQLIIEENSTNNTAEVPVGTVQPMWENNENIKE